MAAPAFSEYAFIALGANLPGDAGDPVDTINAVIPRLQSLAASVLLLSSLYESDPKDCPPDSPRYINAVAALLPGPEESAESLLKNLFQLEETYGRIRTGTINEARTLDLDLLSFRQEIRQSEFLTLPHPRAHERRFVLEPWIEITGGELLLAGQSLQDWLALNTDPELQRIS